MKELKRPQAAVTALMSGADVQAVVTISGPSDLLHPGGEMQIDRPSPVTALVGGDVSTQAEQLRAASPITHVTAEVRTTTDKPGYDVASEAARFFQHYLASATNCIGSPKPRSVMPAV
ncbi:hypothetical protein AB0I34_00325 [Kribbella sp. NPDC050281]|uniref:hypothetical protein n=1 Tax=Kribbella sp. NPDC050281 TaxID=3155515 RepID=UPI0033D44CC6